MGSDGLYAGPGVGSHLRAIVAATVSLVIPAYVVLGIRYPQAIGGWANLGLEVLQLAPGLLLLVALAHAAVLLPLFAALETFGIHRRGRVSVGMTLFLAISVALTAPRWSFGWDYCWRFWLALGWPIAMAGSVASVLNPGPRWRGATQSVGAGRLSIGSGHWGAVSADPLDAFPGVEDRRNDRLGTPRGMRRP